MKSFLITYYSILALGIAAGALWFRRRNAGKPQPPPDPRYDVPASAWTRFFHYLARRLGLTLSDPGIRYTRSPQYAYHMGQRFEGVGEYDRAIGYFAQAVEDAPRWAEPRFRLAMSYIRTGQREKARQQLQFLEGANEDFAAQVRVHLAV